MDSLLVPISILFLVILLFIVVFKRWNQPSPIAYLLAGVVLGPQMTGVFLNSAGIKQVGDIGLLFLMFFLGLEIEIPDNKDMFFRPLIAQTIKIAVTVIVTALAGQILHWPSGRILIVSILLTFNSTAVVSEYLRTTGELKSTMGQVVLHMLLLQDMMVAPVLSAMSISGPRESNWGHFGASVVGSLIIYLLLRAVKNKKLVQLPLWNRLQNDHEFQVFTGTLVCLGCAGIAESAGLSAPIGSFVAGIYLGRTKVFDWLGRTLMPFKVFFVALFFVSIGLSLDMAYLQDKAGLVLVVSFALLAINCGITALVFRLLRYNWAESIMGGALLSQAGELGLLACSVAGKIGLVDEAFSKMAIAATGATLLISILWINILRSSTKTIISRNSPSH